MDKRIIIVSCLVIILLLFYSVAISGERPSDFRGLKWGTHLSKVNGLALDPDSESDINKKQGKRIYIRPFDDLKVGDGKADRIEYVFVKDQLTGVRLHFTGLRQYLIMESLLLDIYGPPDREKKSQGNIELSWNANINDEANVELIWFNFLGKERVAVLMKWKRAMKKDIGL